MAASAAIASAVIGAAGAAKGYMDQKKAAKQQRAAGETARQIAMENAKRVEAETAESTKRLQAQQEQNLGEARAKMAASGVGRGGSQGTFLQGMKTSMQEEVAWLKRSGASQADIARREGDYQSAMAKSGAASTMGAAYGNLGSGLSSAAGAAGQWWQLQGTGTSQAGIAGSSKSGKYGGMGSGWG